MTSERLCPVDVSQVFTSSGSSAPSLEQLIETAGQLDPEELDRLAAEIEKIRLKMRSRQSAGTQQLTDREAEVLVLVASGYNRKEIGRTLRISACTAAKHISNIYRKLGVSTAAEATRVAMQRNSSLLV